MNHLTAIILAAGKGTRLKSTSKNKVVRRLGGKPMILYTTELLKSLGIKDIVVVVGFQAGSVKKALGKGFTFATQKKRLGTGHAVKTALPFVKPSTQNVLVLNADDSAFYSKKDLSLLIKTHLTNKSKLTLLTVVKNDPAHLGRIVRDKQGKVKAIVEFKNANSTQKKIKEINTATYCFDKNFLDQFIPKIQKNPISQEYYLTDLLSLAVNHHQKVSSVKLTDANRFQGINTFKELEIANQLKANATK